MVLHLCVQFCSFQSPDIRIHNIVIAERPRLRQGGPEEGTEVRRKLVDIFIKLCRGEFLFSRF